jgi:S-adenosylmethionine uptake transporter
VSQLSSSIPKSDPKNSMPAIIIAIWGWSAFAIADTISKYLTQSYQVHQIIFINSLIGCIATFLWIYTKHGKASFFSKKWKWHLIRAACVAATAFFIVNALARIPLADFYGIIFLSPMLTAFFSSLLLGEKVHKTTVISIILGFIGVLVLAGPKFQTFNIGIIFAIIGAFAVAINAIIIRKIGTEETPLLFAFFPFLANVILYAPFALTSYQSIAPNDWLLYLSLPPVVILGMVTLSIGYMKAPSASVIAPFHYIQVLWGVTFGYILFNDIPSLSTIIGASIIIMAGLFLIIKER